MSAVLSDDAIAMLNAQAAEWKAAQSADAQRQRDEATAAAKKARLQPFDDALQVCAQDLDAALAAIHASPEWQAAQRAVREAHAALAAERLAGQKRDQLQAAYDTAVSDRDVLLKAAHDAHAAAVATPLADRAAEVAAIEAGK